MPKNHSNEVIIEAIKWLNEIGCDEPLCIDKQSSHNLISDKYNMIYKINTLINVQTTANQPIYQICFNLQNKNNLGKPSFKKKVCYEKVS